MKTLVLYNVTLRDTLDRAVSFHVYPAVEKSHDHIEDIATASRMALSFAMRNNPGRAYQVESIHLSHPEIITERES